ncbi:hypothetical protein A0H76_3012 [Hepatospora eriocheir]|uniref:Uncharacterized protein n=1 Tax=Hepatospora eriocheir TaxID=1081669 RepID=A0A1X0QJA5_9MICR|nr:hypothetical protein A0H76_3012 [Hepatospora eriocheir]
MWVTMLLVVLLLLLYHNNHSLHHLQILPLCTFFLSL